ncbi:AMP-binding protein [Nocardioides sp. YJ-D4]
MALATVHDRYEDDQIAQFYANGLWQQETLFSVLRTQAQVRGDKVFCSDATTSLTYAQLRDAALRLAAGLARIGIVKGDRVAVQMPSWTDFFVIAAAVNRLGAIIVPIMPIYRTDDVAYVVEAAGAKAAFTSDSYRKWDHQGMFLEIAGGDNLLETVIVVRPDEVRDGAIALADVLADVDPATADAELGDGAGPDEPFSIVFTSGTTARPKGCLHTFNTVACGARLLSRGWAYDENDVQFGPSPVTHTTGLVTSFVLPLIHGAATHVMEQWNPREALERIAKFGCTAAVTATTFLQTVMEVYDPDVHDASTMRFWTCAGSPIPGAFVEKARATLPTMQVLSLYGRTENVTTTMCTFEDDPARSITSDGKALPLQEVRIVDELGNEVPTGTEGDIAYRGAMNCLEYINQPDETIANYTSDGFHRSGDLGVMDQDGYVRVTGRLKDIVIRGGMNISVRQVEDMLIAHPAIRDIAVVAMPDEQMGERACAYVVPAEGHPALTLDEVRVYLTGRGLAIQKVPERLEILGEMPMTATGKIQKHVLRGDIVEKLRA